MHQMIIYVIYIVLLLIFTSIVPIIIDSKNRKDISCFLSLLSESFHLNNASVFIGYTVFDFNVIFLVMYVFSFVIYLLEHFFVIEDKKTGRALQIAQVVVVIIGIVGQIWCTYIILNDPKIVE